MVRAMPEVYDLAVRAARVEGREGLVDVGVSAGRIVDVASQLDAPAEVELGADGRLASPALIEPHAHLDKTGLMPVPVSGQGGALARSIDAMAAAKREATVEGIRERAGALIRRMVLAGTTTIRTHVDVDTDAGLKGLEGVIKARDDHADLCDVEIVAFPQYGTEGDPAARELMTQALAAGADIVGGMPHWEVDHEAARRQIDFCLQLAVQHDVDVDMHVDETDDPAWHSLELLIDATEKYGWQGRVSAGHCCAMAAWEDAYAAQVARRAADASLTIICNPATNLVVQGREDPEPRRRGITRVKELLAAGVNVAAGQDNVHDGFYPLGAGDPLVIAWLLVHVAQLTTPQEIEQALEAVRGSAARALRLPDYGIFPGARADFVVIDAESPEQALRELAPRRWVVHGGRLVADTSTARELHRAGAADAAVSPTAASGPSR
jgi:cytosine deaminase